MAYLIKTAKDVRATRDAEHAPYPDVTNTILYGLPFEYYPDNPNSTPGQPKLFDYKTNKYFYRTG